MKGLGTIFKRELRAYFITPIGYIFIIAFVVINVALFITGFFAFPMADMRNFFNVLPLVMCVFVPAVTMRLWTEDRRSNTLEMLLTFPIPTGSVVLGKFLASLAFLAIALAGTFTIPLMLARLGDPDQGQIAASYFGAILMGALFLAIGLLVSGVCNDQIAAFVISLVACFGAYLLGTNFIASAIDGWISGMGTFLKRVVGVSPHYETFTRGVIEATDLVFFLGWTVVFLFLNRLYMEGRSRPGARSFFATAVVLAVGIGGGFNALVGNYSLGRLDLTEGKIYTVSPASRKILSELRVPVQVTYYVSPADQMPTEWKNLERDVTDKLNELRIASAGKLQFKTVYMDVSNLITTSMFEEEEKEKTRKETLEERLLQKGVRPFSVRAYREASAATTLLYSALGMAYMDKEGEIIPQVVQDDLAELEYRVVSTVYRLTREEPVKIALVAPLDELAPEMARLYMQMGQPVPAAQDRFRNLERFLRRERYDVRRVRLDRSEPLPDDYDVLMVVNPRQLNERQQWELARAMAEGKRVFLAVQNYEWNYRQQGNRVVLSREDVNPQINALLEPLGLKVDEQVLMDVNHTPLTVTSGTDVLSALLGGATLDLPFHVLITRETMNEADPITSRVSTVFYLWGTAISLNEEKLKENGLEYSILMSTTEKAWVVSAERDLTQRDFEPPSGGTRSYPLLVKVKGEFPFVFQDKPRPPWPATPPRPGMPPPADEESPESPLTPAPGLLFLTGCSETLRDEFITRGNLDLALNCVDYLAYGEDLVSVRSKRIIDRAISKPSAATEMMWKVINYAVVSIVVASIGIGHGLARRAARERYELQFSQSGTTTREHRRSHG